MLPLLLMLLSDPAAPPAPVATLEPRTRLRGLDGLQACAEGGYQRIERRSGQADLLRNDLVDRPDNEVRRYLLLDRSIRGCPAPISYPLPGRQGGFIRELGPSRPVAPAPPRVQPPRSSE